MVEVNSFSIKINVDNWWHWFPNVPIKHFFLFCDYSHAFPHFSNQCKLFWSKMITSIAVTILHAIGESAGNICLVYNFEVCMNMNTVVTCKQLFNYLFILPGSSVHIPGNMNNCTCWLQMKFYISRIYNCLLCTFLCLTNVTFVNQFDLQYVFSIPWTSSVSNLTQCLWMKARCVVA